MAKKIRLNGISLSLLSLIFFAAITWTAYVPTQGDAASIIVPYIIAFGIYTVFTLYFEVENYFLHLVFLAVASRLVLVFSFPNLSDDLYRFLWDANLILEGKNPYLYLPTDIVTEENQQLFNQLNSQDYYSPYPPFSQLIYVMAAYISEAKIEVFAIIIKAFTFLAELGSIYFIVKILDNLQLDKSRVFLYALNPLILIELMGNIHFESFMILFLLMTVYYLIKRQQIKSAITFVLAIISKLLPLMFAPFIAAYLGIKRSFRYGLVVGGLLLIVLIPVLVSMLDGVFFSSVGLYFQKFEFNASMYYLLREVGYLLYGYNLIGELGPFLGIATLSSILWVWYKYRTRINQDNIFLFLLFTISIYLAFATTVHPWYVSLPLVFCLFTDFRYPVLWSGLIMLTYVNYSYSPYHENLLIVAIEYLLVYTFFFIEFRKFKNKKALLN